MPSGPVNDVLAAFDQPQARRARDARVGRPSDAWLDRRRSACPIKLSATPASIRTAPPLLGEHSAEILAELGYDEPAVANLRDRGAV